jgi:hypothetical protein
MDEKYKIHAAYILTILIVIIVVLITVKWRQIPNLAELITFALSLSSLILAILAIGYAFYSNSSFSQNISTLNNASRDVSDTAIEISRAAEELAQKIEFIPSKLERMEGKVEQTNILLRQYSEKQEAQIPDQHEMKAAGEISESFVSKTSMSGLFILYACSVAYSKGIPFNLEDFCKTVGNIIPKYAEGFLVAINSAGLLTYNESKGIYSIIDMNERLRNALRSELDERLTSVDKNWNNTRVDKEEYKKVASSKFSVIEQYLT